MQEELLDRRAGECENRFIKAWDSGAKEEALEIESGGHPPWTSLLIPGVKVWWGPLELRTGEAKYTPEECGFGVCSEKSESWRSLSWRFYLVSIGGNSRGGPREGSFFG